MKKVLLGLAAALGLALVAIVALAATKPATFRVQRSATIAAPPETVFAELNDFRRWADWSPWEKLDPQMKKQYSGSQTGEGAIYEWDGNEKAGQGRMTITESKPSSKVVIHLEFIKPFPGDNQTTFSVAAADGGSHVDWLMTGPNSFMSKIMSVFADLDAFIGPDFERGLANLKAVCEKH